jgi:hypothetical protein
MNSKMLQNLAKINIFFRGLTGIFGASRSLVEKGQGGVYIYLITGYIAQPKAMNVYKKFRI